MKLNGFMKWVYFKNGSMKDDLYISKIKRERKEETNSELEGQSREICSGEEFKVGGVLGVV